MNSHTKREHLATFRVNKDVWDKFQDWSKSQDLSASLAICKLIDACLEGSITSLTGGLNIGSDSSGALALLQAKVSELEEQIKPSFDPGHNPTIDNIVSRLDELEKKVTAYTEDGLTSLELNTLLGLYSGTVTSWLKQKKPKYVYGNWKYKHLYRKWYLFLN